MHFLTTTTYFLDLLRCKVLHLTLQNPFAQKLFLNRPLRHFIFLFSYFILSISLSIIFPLWVLALGPTLYGVPHLISSCRYLPYLFAGKSLPKVYPFLFSLTLLLAFLRLLSFSTLTNFPFSEWAFDNRLELLFAILLFAGTLLLSKEEFSKNVKRIIFVLFLFSTFAFFSLHYPGPIIGGMILFHNFVGFLYWIAVSKNIADKFVATIGLIIFSLLHVAIFVGTFDFTRNFFSILWVLPFSELDTSIVGASILPWTEDPNLLVRAVYAYAFGQSVHYFLWLRILPEIFLQRPAPVTFRQSLGFLKKDFGEKGVYFLICILLASFALWIVLKFPVARTTYFTIAAFHGYSELTGLLLYLSLKKNSNLPREKIRTRDC